jgi:hypothetical protein
MQHKFDKTVEFQQTNFYEAFSVFMKHFQFCCLPLLFFLKFYLFGMAFEESE